MVQGNIFVSDNDEYMSRERDRKKTKGSPKKIDKNKKFMRPKIFKYGRFKRCLKPIDVK